MNHLDSQALPSLEIAVNCLEHIYRTSYLAGTPIEKVELALIFLAHNLMEQGEIELKTFSEILKNSKPYVYRFLASKNIAPYKDTVRQWDLAIFG